MISNDFIIQRTGGGIQLTTPSEHHYPSNSVADIMRHAMNVYFMDPDSKMLRLNELTAETGGYISINNAIGKSIRDVSKQETVAAILKNDGEVIRSRKYSVTSESYTRNDDVDLTAISIKFPWLTDNKVIGIFGCSILLNHAKSDALANSLFLLMQTGLLASITTSALTHKLGFKQINGIYFDKNDMQILYLLIRGQTAKSIAKSIKLSHRTIEHRLEAIKHKLAVTSKSELIERIIDQLVIV